MLQPFANHLIGTQQVGRGDALAVGRVGHDDALLAGLLEVLEVLLLNGNAGRQTGSLNVAAGGVDGLRVDVVAVEVALDVLLLVLLTVVVYAVEEVGVEVGPLLEGILLAKQPRSHVVGDECRLDEQRARAAHGVDEVGVALPARQHNHAGSKHLVQRSLHRLLAVTAAVQRLAAAVERQRAVVLGHVDVQPQVGVGHRDVGAVARLLAELVDDGVLHLVADKLRVAEFLGENDGVDGKGLVVA